MFKIFIKLLPHMLPYDLLITKIVVLQNDQLSLWKFCPFPRKNWIHINIHRWKNRRETNFVDKNFCLLAKFLSFFPEEGSFNQVIEKENIVVIFATGLCMSMIKIYFHLVFLLWLVLIFSRVMSNDYLLLWKNVYFFKASETDFKMEGPWNTAKYYQPPRFGGKKREGGMNPQSPGVTGHVFHYWVLKEVKKYQKEK